MQWIRFIPLASDRVRRFMLPLFVTLLLVGCSRVNPENLAKIKMGMTSTQVSDILGKPDETQSQGAVGLTSTTYLYRKGTSEVKIVLLNDHVVATEGSLK